MIALTDAAQAAVQKFIEKSDKPVTGLRISVTSGGCSGMNYGMALEEAAGSEDHVVEMGSAPALKVFVDPESASMLMGVTVDYVETLEGAGFKFDNPNAAAACSCGKSFS